MSNVNMIVANYIGAWNERDAVQRRVMVAQTWTEDGSYIDAHRHAVGHEEISAMIEAVQHQLPGYSLRLVSGIEAHNGHVRFSWAAGGAPDAPLYIAGTDFVSAGVDGRLAKVVGFADAAPAT
jgi:SnoaL-like domain